jgi:hypothetical protein
MEKDNTLWISIMFMSAVFVGLSAFFLNYHGGIIFGYLFAHASFKELCIVKTRDD